MFHELKTVWKTQTTIAIQAVSNYWGLKYPSSAEHTTGTDRRKQVCGISVLTGQECLLPEDLIKS